MVIRNGLNEIFLASGAVDRVLRAANYVRVWANPAVTVADAAARSTQRNYGPADTATVTEGSKRTASFGRRYHDDLGPMTDAALAELS